MTTIALNRSLSTELVDKQSLPIDIANAVANIYESSSFGSLNANTKQIFSCLIQFGLKLDNPTQSIFVKKSSLAKSIST